MWKTWGNGNKINVQFVCFSIHPKIISSIFIFIFVPSWFGPFAFLLFSTRTLAICSLLLTLVLLLLLLLAPIPWLFDAVYPMFVQCIDQHTHTRSHSIKRMLGTKDVRKLKTHTHTYRDTLQCRHCVCDTSAIHTHGMCDILYLASVEKSLNESLRDQLNSLLNDVDDFHDDNRCVHFCLHSRFSCCLLANRMDLSISPFVCVFIIGFCRLCLITSFYICGIDLWVYFVITRAKKNWHHSLANTKNMLFGN